MEILEIDSLKVLTSLRRKYIGAISGIRSSQERTEVLEINSLKVLTSPTCRCNIRYPDEGFIQEFKKSKLLSNASKDSKALIIIIFKHILKVFVFVFVLFLYFESSSSSLGVFWQG